MKKMIVQVVNNDHRDNLLKFDQDFQFYFGYLSDITGLQAHYNYHYQWDSEIP